MSRVVGLPVGQPISPGHQRVAKLNEVQQKQLLKLLRTNTARNLAKRIGCAYYVLEELRSDGATTTAVRDKIAAWLDANGG